MIHPTLTPARFVAAAVACLVVAGTAASTGDLPAAFAFVGLAAVACAIAVYLIDRRSRP